MREDKWRDYGQTEIVESEIKISPLKLGEGPRQRKQQKLTAEQTSAGIPVALTRAALSPPRILYVLSELQS